MKPRNVMMALILMTGVVITGSGCLKDKLYDDGVIQSEHATKPQPKVVDIALNVSSYLQFVTLTLDSVNADTTVDLVPINLATPGPATQDVHVTVSLDPTVVSALNAEYGTNFIVPPASRYSIVDSVVTIPRGSNNAFLQIKLNPAEFSGPDWALGFRITHIQEKGYTVSGNLNTGVVNITN